MDIPEIRYEDVAYIDEIIKDGKKYLRLHVPIYDDSKYEQYAADALIENLEKHKSNPLGVRQMHIILDGCYREVIDKVNDVDVIVCFYTIPKNAILDESYVTYHFPQGVIDTATDDIPTSYLTKKRVTAMLDALKFREKRESMTIEKVIQFDSDIPIDKRDEAYRHLAVREYNYNVRKPLNPSSIEYKKGKRAIYKLFRYYLQSLIKNGLKDCKKEIRDKIPNISDNKTGRKGIKPDQYLFCLIDQVHEKRPDNEYKGMMDDMVKAGWYDKSWALNSIGVYASKPELIPFLQFLITYSSAAFNRYEHIFAVDSTGFRCTTRNDYYGDKHHQKKENDWVDAHALVGVDSNIVIALKIVHKYKEDELIALEDLVIDATRYFFIDYLLGDGGYMSEDKLNYYAENYNIRLVFPIKTNTVIHSNTASPLWNDNNQLNLSDIWNDIYHPRSNVESTFSSIKRTVGETVNARNETARLIEVYCKFIAYNIRTLIMYYFVAGIVPQWIDNNHVKSLLGEK